MVHVIPQSHAFLNMVLNVQVITGNTGGFIATLMIQWLIILKKGIPNAKKNKVTRYIFYINHRNKQLGELKM